MASSVCNGEQNESAVAGVPYLGADLEPGLLEVVPCHWTRYPQPSPLWLAIGTTHNHPHFDNHCFATEGWCNAP